MRSQYCWIDECDRELRDPTYEEGNGEYFSPSGLVTDAKNRKTVGVAEVPIYYRSPVLRTTDDMHGCPWLFSFEPKGKSRAYGGLRTSLVE